MKALKIIVWSGMILLWVSLITFMLACSGSQNLRVSELPRFSNGQGDLEDIRDSIERVDKIKIPDTVEWIKNKYRDPDVIIQKMYFINISGATYILSVTPGSREGIVIYKYRVE